VEFSQTLAFGRTLNFEPVVVATAFPQFAMTPGGLTLHFTPVAVATAFPAFSITGSHVAERLGQLLSSEPVRFDKGTGAPVHTAPKGTPYWRLDNNTFYVNNNGATSWTQIGGASGMADHGNEYHTPDFEAEGVAAGLVTTHVAAANPHPAYQEESEKGQYDGYAPLDGSAFVPVDNLGSGPTDSTKYLRGDRVWAVPPGSTPAFVVNEVRIHFGSALPHGYGST
jgi:hypothetical protein